MTTATMPTAAPAETPIPVPVEPDLASMLYDQTEPVAPPVPEPAAEPAVVSDQGPAPLPVKDLDAAPDLPKVEPSPVGEETKPKPAEEKGHAAAARRLGSEVADLKRTTAALAEENRVLTAKLAGTYEEPVQPTTPELEARAEFKGRETASRAVAEGLFGAEAVQTQVYDDESPYKRLVQAQPWLHVRVAKSAQPTVEAMRVLEEQAFLAKYGTDVRQWVTKIEAELKPKILDDLKRQSVTPLIGKQAPSVTEARGSGGPVRSKSLEDLFYGKPPAPGS